MNRVLVGCLVALLGAALGVEAQTLTGSWTVTATVAASPITLGIDSELVVTYNVSTWSFAGDAVFDETGWAKMRVAGTGTLGEVTLASTLTLAPTNPAAFFSQWATTATATLYGVVTVGTFTLAPGDAQFVLDGSGSLGMVTVRAVMTLGDTSPDTGCDFGWQGVGITVDVPLCCVDLKGRLDITCDGFDSLSITATNIVIPNLPWFTLTALLTFAVDEKTLVVSPSFNYGAEVCFDVYVSMGKSGNLDLSHFAVDGLGIDCRIGGIEFAGQSYWGSGTKPSLLTGTPYWEAYQIRASGDECCGPVDVEVTVYFLEDGLELFDLGKVAGVLKVELSRSFTLSSGLELELGASSTVTWTLGFLVEW